MAWSLVMLAVVLGTSSAAPATPGAVDAARAGWLQVVAHEDDDLLFMSPTLDDAIVRGDGPVTTVYLTAGDAGRDAAYWRSREAGMRAAYAFMAGAPDAWDPDILETAGVRFFRFRLTAAPHIALLFLRLPDGCDHTCPNGPAVDNTARLWRGSLDALATVDGARRYRREALIAALARIMERYAPAHVGLLDCTGAHGHDHDDHHHSALFGLAAAARAGIPDVVLHRGYNMTGAPANLATSDVLRKGAVFAAYMPYDAALCPDGPPCPPDARYASWLERFYPLPGPFTAGSAACTAP
jgi:LmbE family N-acetylglucosaminyl deacetylase